MNQGWGAYGFPRFPVNGLRFGSCLKTIGYTRASIEAIITLTNKAARNTNTTLIAPRDILKGPRETRNASLKLVT